MHFKIYLILLFSLLLNAQNRTVIVEAEGSGMSKQKSFKMAIENARSKASFYFDTKVENKITRNNNGFNLKSTQTSSTKLKLIHYFDDKYSYLDIDFGRVWNTKLKAKFELIEVIETPKKEIAKNNIPQKSEPPKKETPTQKIEPKPKIVKNEPSYNFQVSVNFKFKNRRFLNLNKYILIIPNHLFDKLKFDNVSFEKNGQTHKKIKKYLHKIKNNKIYKNISKGKYKVAFLIGNDFFLIESKNYKPNFRSLNFQRGFIKNYSLSDSDFRAW